MCGQQYKIKFKKNHRTSGSFNIATALIEIRQDSGFGTLLHELQEAAFTEQFCRYYTNDGCIEMLFSFGHDKFTTAVEEVAGAIQQILPKLSDKKREQWKLK